jgi:glutaredoxin-like protein
MTTPDITVYWRPGCGFCSMLFAQLENTDLSYAKVNIWEDPTAAETVRSIANGNETVPTVTIGDKGLVNPSINQILAALA